MAGYGFLGTGLHPITGVVIILAVGILLFWWWKKGQDKAKKKKLQGYRILCDFHMKNGKRRYYWCETPDGTAELSDEEKKKVEQLAKKYGYKGDITKLGAVTPAEGSTLPLPRYFVEKEFIFDVMWPIDKPETQQVSVQCCSFYEDIPLPAIALMVSKWTPTMLQELASSLIGLAADKDTMRALNAQDHSFWSNLNKAVQLLGQLPMIKYSGFAAALGGLLAALLAFLVMNKMNTLISLFVPGGG